MSSDTAVPRLRRLAAAGTVVLLVLAGGACSDDTSKVGDNPVDRDNGGVNMQGDPSDNESDSTTSTRRSGTTAVPGGNPAGGARTGESGGP